TLVKVSVTGLAEVVEQDRSVDSVQPRVPGVPRVLSLVERPLHLSPNGDQLVDIARLDGQGHISSPHVGVDGASVPDVDANAPPAGLGFDVGSQHIAGNV